MRPESARIPMNVAVPIGGGIALILSILVLALGFSGISAIKRSDGRLRGLGLAVFVAWLIPLGIADALALTPAAQLRDREAWAAAVSISVLVVIVLDVLFLRWQYGRHRAEMAAA